MKTTGTCPKCKSRKLWIVEHVETKDPNVGIGGAMPLVLAASRKTPATRAGTLLKGDGSTFYDAGQLDAFVCARCGFSELWARGFEQLVHNPADGIHFVDGEQPR